MPSQTYARMFRWMKKRRRNRGSDDEDLDETAEEDYERAVAFCGRRPVECSMALPPSVIERIAREGCNAWELEFRITDPGMTSREAFCGTIRNRWELKHHHGIGIVTKVESTKKCMTCCLISNLPFIAGLYNRPNIPGRGVYFELTIHEMKGAITMGTICRPYPHFSHPGWHRLSAALHFDDLYKFYDDSDGQESGFWDAMGGRSPVAGDTIGCGYEFATSSMFFTYNGHRLKPDAFRGLYLGTDYDVYVAIGLRGENVFHVNFGGDHFKWVQGNDLGWRLNAHVGNSPSGSQDAVDDQPPIYSWPPT